MLLVSVMMEYDNLAQRLSLMENNIDLALDRSIDAATASEELFTAKYQEELASHGLTGGAEIGAVTTSHKKALGANMTVWGGDSWYDASSYVLASFYPVHGRLPKTANEYHQYARFDFYVENRYLIEYDGEQHFYSTGGWNSLNQFKNLFH